MPPYEDENELLESNIIKVQDPDELLEENIVRTVKGKSKPKKLLKPVKPAPVITGGELQQFKRPSLPPQDLSPDRFRFETTPFRESPEQYLLRSTPFEKLTPEERLIRHEQEARAKGKPLVSMKAAPKRKGRLEALKEGKVLTAIFGEPPTEEEQIQQEQRLYDMLGPTGYSVVEGVRRAGRTLGEPFEQTFGKVLEGEMPGGPPKPARPPIPIIRKEREAPISKVLPPAIEYGSMFIPFRAGGRGPRIDEGPLPELGGPPPKVPPRIGPGRVIEGQPPLGGPLELRRGRTIVGFPTVRPPEKPVHIPPPPNMLARRQTEPFPMHDQLIMSERVGPMGEPIADDLSFDLLPGMKPGEAPVMISPQWVMDAVTPGATPGIAGGWNIQFDQLPMIYNNIRINAPSPEHAKVAIESISDLHKSSIEEGLHTISLIDRSMSTEELRPKLTGHETFHSGQSKIGMEKLGEPTVRIHSTEWANQNPYIQEISAKFPGKRTSDQWADELPAYIAARQSNYTLGTTRDVDFQYDYYKHIAELHGVDALDIIGRTARLSPESQEILQSARSTFESYERARTSSSQPGSTIEGADLQPGAVRGVSEMAEGGLKRRGDQEEVGGVDRSIEFALSDPSRISLPEQVKSATGTFDPDRSKIAMSEKPPYAIGDLIKVKGMGPAKVTKVFDDGLEVTYESNNAVDEVNFDAIESKLPDIIPKVTKVTSIVSPKGFEKGRVPSLPGPMRIRKNRLFVNRIGPGDEPGKVKIEFGNGTISQFDIKDVKDASGRKIKDPIHYMLVEDPPEGIISPPPPPTPRDPSLPPGGDSPLFTPIVGVTHTRVIAKKFIDLISLHKIEYDTTKPPSTQIYEAMIRGDLKDIGVEEVLKEEGIEWEDFIEDVLGTYSIAGKTLQPLSEIEQRHWKRLREENPALFNKLVPAHRQIQLVLDDLSKTNLGMSLWRRSGRMIQKAVLTQVATAMTNFIGATGRVPMDSGSSAIGQAMRQMMEGEGTFGERMDKAREASRETFKAGFEAWRALNPMQIEALSRGQLGREYEGYENIVQQLETYFPDLHAKLFTKPMEETAQKLTGEKLPLHVELDPRTKLVGARENVHDMRKLLPKVKNKTKRRELQQEINKLEKNIKREESVLIKMGFRGPEMFYDQLLRPMQFGEFLMRKARFVSRLGSEMKDRGMDLNQVIQEGSFKNIPSDAIKSSINDALEFTMALEPTNDPNANNFERASYHVVKLMNHLGPLSLVTDTMFIRAMYSAFNTFYEYSSLPLLNPGEWMRKGSFGRIFRGKDDLDPATGEPYRTNPASRDDYDKFGRMAMGTILYILAGLLIKLGLVGNEWYQVKTGKKDEKRNPIYVDIRRYIPQSRIFQLAYLIDRGLTGRLNDVPIGREALDIATGIKRYETDPDLISTLDAIGEYWGGPDWNPREIDKSSQLLGRYPAALLTPLLNIRSIVAAHDEDENIKKDLRGSGFWGPSIDRFPWLRQRLPDLTYPTFQGKIPLSESPALQQFGGIQISTSPEFVGREFSRMGINIREYLPKDPDPIIDKRQNEVFNFYARVYGNALMNDPSYVNASDKVRAFRWEQVLIGDDGIVASAREEGLDANPKVAIERMMKEEFPGRFTRGVLGISEYLDRMKER